MAFFEREFIEIKRDNYKMNIIGTLTGSVEEEDVRQYITAFVKKEKRAIVGNVVLMIIVWLLAMIYPIGEFVFSNNPNPHLGPGGIAITVIFSLIALYCTVISVKAVSSSKKLIAKADLDSPEQIIADAPDAVIWKMKKQWEMCYSHDLVPLESAVKGRPLFLEDGPLMENRAFVMRRMSAAQRSLREREEIRLVEYAAALMKSRTSSNGPLTVYLDIDKLGGGVYGLSAGRAVAGAVPAAMLEGMRVSSGDSRLAAGQALGRALPASEMEGIAVFSGDSAATLNGSANEYAVAFSGNSAKLDRIEALLRDDKTIAGLLSGSGIRRGETQEPLVADGTVQNGELTAPAGHSPSFCAVGFNKTWKG